MPFFDLSPDTWAQVSDGSSSRLIVLQYGEVLVSEGIPGVATAAKRLGGASGSSLGDGRLMRSDAVLFARAAGAIARVYVGDDVAPDIPVLALLSALDGRVLLSPIDGRVLLRAA